MNSLHYIMVMPHLYSNDQELACALVGL